jgi:hypothetical protein
MGQVCLHYATHLHRRYTVTATVVNKYKVCMDDEDIVYIGRGSKWGNPYSHMDGTKAYIKVESREHAIELYRQYVWQNLRSRLWDKEDFLELDGKRLACYCKPRACHGDVLVAALEWAKKEIDNVQP